MGYKMAIKNYGIQVFELLFLYLVIGIYPIKAQDFFTDITEEAGIDFRYNFGDPIYDNILESSGSGISILDYNNDGYMDIYMLNGTYLEDISIDDGIMYENSSNILYRNNGDGTFTDVTLTAGVDDRHWSMAAAVFDVNNDGYQDIYLLNYGPNVFYMNNGDGTFSDSTRELGLGGPEKLNGFEKWSVGAVFWDYNDDGLGDIMVGNFLAFDPSYVSETTPGMMPHPSEYKGQASLLYEQQTDGTFREVTEQAGLYFPDSKCMGLTVFDFDQDGDRDLFQGNDHQLNFLFRNDGNRIFTEIGVGAGVAANDQGLPTGSMHGSVGDIDGDGLVDLLVTDLRYGALYRNRGDGSFEDITQKSNVARYFNGKGQWGANLFDHDNDGDLDIFTTNGTAEELIRQLPLLLDNQGNGKFQDVGPQRNPFFLTKRSGRASATIDFDNDGDLDLLISHLDFGSPVFLRNNEGNKNHWIGLMLEGKDGAASSLSVEVTVYYGNMKRTYINQPANTYLTYNDPRMHIGLGQHSFIDKLEIKWFGSDVEVIENIKADRYLRIKQGQGIY